MEPSFAELLSGALDQGRPMVYEEGDQVSLMFDMKTVQSRMNRQRPNDLVLGYTRSMMAFVLLHDAPRRIGMIGLGGGSLAKYCYHHCPQAEIDVAEISSDVIALRQQFLVPDDARLQIHCRDGALWLADTEPCDALLVDAYGPQGMPGELASPRFFDLCYARLNRHGVLVVNLWGTDARFDSYFDRIKSCFGRAIAIGADSSANRIVLAQKDSPFPPNLRRLQQRCREQSAAHTVDLEGLAKRILAATSDPEGIDPAARQATAVTKSRRAR